MTLIEDWAKDWAIPEAALKDLRARIIPEFQTFDEIGDGSESRVQSFVKLEGAEHNVLLTRNNVGAGIVVNPRTKREDFLRWGLMNETQQVNAKFKSGDLIGLRPVKITQAMVGRVFGQFVSRECKRADWKWSGNAHEQAQMNWANIVNGMGGDAKIVNGPGSF